jgi:flagellar biosynthesis/type III secretory pathway M-ring protein FliF/YscJ
MELLKSQVARIAQQLAGLTATQKMLAAALVVIMVMTLLYGARNAGTAEMEALLDQSFSRENIVAITGELDSRGITNKVTGDKIFIPADKKWQVMAILGYAQLLPSDTTQGFDALVKGINPLESNSMTDRKFAEYRAATMAKIIRQFPNVRDAAVIVDGKTQRRIGESIAPTATIQITTKGNVQQNSKQARQLADAAASVVVGANAGMPRGNVVVLVDGKRYKIDGGDAEANGGGIGGSEILERIAETENYYRGKIANQLQFMDNVIVDVSVSIDASATRQRSQAYDPKATFTKPLEEETRTTETNTGGAPAEEPGALPNTGMSIAGAGGAGGSTSTETEERTKHAQYAAVVEKNTVTPAGTFTVKKASVRVPRSYFVRVWGLANPNGKEPTEDTILAMANAEFPRIRNDVVGLTNIADPQDISVEMYFDTDPTGLGGPGRGGTVVGAEAASGVASSLPLGIGSYGKEIAIGALAIVSLFMVTSMVKKGTPTAMQVPTNIADDFIPPPGVLSTGELIAGEAGSAGDTLDAMELDDDAVRAQQMLDQVSNMVKENPDSAASLVKRWMNRS